MTPKASAIDRNEILLMEATGKSSLDIFRLRTRDIRKTQPSSPNRRTSVSSPRLPVEICETMLKNLYDDPSTLSACCLACREWIYTIRSHRFNQVYLTQLNLFSFLHLLRPSPDIGLLVRHVSVHLPYHPSVSMHLHLGHALDQIFACLKVVESLALRCVIVTPFFLKTLSRLSSVKRLEFGSACRAATDEHMEAVCRAFPLLAHIAITGAPDVDRLFIRLARVLRLIVVVPFQPADEASSWSRRFAWTFCQCFLRSSPVVIGPSHRMRCRGIEAVLTGAGASLQNLSIELSSLPWIEPNAVESGMAKCTNLRSIDFYGEPFFERPHSFMPIWIHEFLSLITTTSIRTICFHFHALELRWNLDALSFVRLLPESLARDHFRNLEKVIFRIQGRELKMQAEEYVRKEIPELETRGLLAFYST